jgi:ABC-type polysaccharide/polyol phosphate export permease
MSIIEERSAKLGAFQKIQIALTDVVYGTVRWRPWFFMGFAEVQQRYRRSFIGPFWVTLTMAIQVSVTGLLLAFLFKQDVNRYLPFICISLIIWTYFSSVMNEGAMSFISMSGIILQVRRPLWTYIMLILWRNAIVFLHTIPIFFVASWYFGIFPSVSYILIPFALIIFVANVAWMALLIGCISARFHDIPPIVQNSLNVLVWLTPVYYNPSQISGRTLMIISLNPLTSIIEIVRGPFLNDPPDMAVWSTGILVACFGWAMAIAVFARVKSRIPYWL